MWTEGEKRDLQPIIDFHARGLAPGSNLPRWCHIDRWDLESPQVVGVVGDMGAGKTSFTLAFALYLASELECPLYTNFDQPGALVLTHQTDLWEATNGIVVLDEAQTIADSRMSQSRDSRESNRWFEQCRKLGSHAFLISQLAGKIDVRMRQLLTRLLIMRRVSQRKGDMRTSIEVVRTYDAKLLATSRFDRRVMIGRYDHRRIIRPLEAPPVVALATDGARSRGRSVA